MQIKLPTERGGWLHEYICPVHGSELLLEHLLGGQFPADGANCPHGCQLDTPTVRGAWTVLAHQACTDGIVELATGADAAGHQQALGLLVEYAERYAAAPSVHEGSQAWMLKGRLFHQALTEAIWGVKIGRAVRALVAAGVELPGSVRELLTGLAAGARQGRDQMVADDKFDSNYVAWLNAAGASCTGAADWLTDEHGLFEHLRASVLPDGWQWEASSYYHSFVLRAAEKAIAAVAGVEVPADIVEIMARMREVLMALRAPGGYLPATHDTPYLRAGCDAELAELRLGELVGEPIRVFPDGGYAVVRHAGIHAVLAFGPHGGSHGHYDKLALNLYGPTEHWQSDPGQVPYAHKAWRNYYASTAAHPAFRVDGAEQQACTGELVSQSADEVVVACDQAYPGVRAVRTLRLADGELVDELRLSSATEHRYELLLRPGTDCQYRPSQTGFETTWGRTELLHGRHECDQPAELFVHPGPGPADDPQRVVRQAEWLVAAASEVTFTSRYRTDQALDAG